MQKATQKMAYYSHNMCMNTLSSNTTLGLGLDILKNQRVKKDVKLMLNPI